MRLFNRIISLLLVMILIIASFINNIVFTSNAAPIITAYIEGSDVNVRKEASTKAQIIEQISYRNATV